MLGRLAADLARNSRVNPGTVRPILTGDDPIWSQPCPPVEAHDAALTTNVADLAATLADFKARSGFGRAIAAPQIGIAKRLVVMDLGAGPVALVNPEITWRSVDGQTVWDDCLSVPDRVVQLHRARSISISYSDALGRQWVWERLAPDMAELLQHEIDHLEGTLISDHASGPDTVAPVDRHAALVGAARPAPRVTPAGIMTAAEQIDHEFAGTPLFEAETLSERHNCRVFLKVETLNPIRCFKGRGAGVFVRRHTRAKPGEPIVTASAGNWGQALAYFSRRWEVPFVVFAAETANAYKLDRMRAMGADVRLAGADFDQAKTAARAHAEAVGAVFVEDGKELSVTEGHGSCGMEILAEFDHRIERCEDIMVPLGNGALVNGIGTWTRASSPATRVVAVSAAGASAMHQSFSAGSGAPVMATNTVDTIADGLAVRVPIPEAVADMHQAVHDSLLVDDDTIVAAMEELLDHAGLVTEPAGAAGLAAVMAYPARFAERNVVVVVTGSNVDPSGADRARLHR